MLNGTNRAPHAMEIPLRYGCNPHQGNARLLTTARALPLRVLNGEPGYINVLDALTGWQLVREVAAATRKPAAASYKHVSPAGVAVAAPISDEFARAQFLERPPTDPVAQAYVRARGADRVSSFGDAAAVSHRVTIELAAILRREVSDLIVAPGFDPDALELLQTKKGGRYLILEIDPDYEPEPIERRDVFGLSLEQERNTLPITADLFLERQPDLPADIVETLVVATTALKYTQSNSVCVAWQGQVIGMAAGQQSRIHCTRLACDKAEKWMLQTHPAVLALAFPEGMRRPDRYNAIDQSLRLDELTPGEKDHLRAALGREPAPLPRTDRTRWYERFPGLCLASDAFIPFRDNIDRAARTGVRYVAHAGGTTRAAEIHAAAAEHGIALIETGVRCFLH